MGNDGPLACLADQPRLMYDYFRQLFAQVTNPPIDPIRESIVMSLECYIGPQGNILDVRESQCHRLMLPSPVLSLEFFNALRNLQSVHSHWPVCTLDITFDKSKGVKGYVHAVERICEEASEAIEDGFKVIILSAPRCAQRLRWLLRLGRLEKFTIFAFWSATVQMQSVRI